MTSVFVDAFGLTDTLELCHCGKVKLFCEIVQKFMCLFSSESLLLSCRLDFGGGGSGNLLSRPVVLGLGHSVTKGVLVLGPFLLRVGSTLHVEFGVIFEDTGLGDISLVVGFLLSLF